MQLLTATVRNYRIHRETVVDFDPLLNLLGGPNESGKSTLVEAIHRALFLKSTTGGAIHESMVSTLHSGHPEVELRFRANGKTYLLQKIFSRASGKTMLTEEGGEVLHNDSAETKLASLLQVEEAGGGRGGANRATSQWGHLWVWQGTGGSDPSEHSASQKDALLSKLKDQGGGAVMQSELDARVADAIEEKYDTIFTKGGKIKAGSGLHDAETDLTRAEEEAARAATVFEKLEQAMHEDADAGRTLADAEKATEDQSAQLAAARETLAAATTLKHREEVGRAAHEKADGEYRQFSTALAEIESLEKQIAELSARAAPGSRDMEKMEAKRREQQDALTRLDAERSDLEARNAASQILVEWADASARLFGVREHESALRKRQREVLELEERRGSLAPELAKLPEIDAAGFRELQRLNAELSEAQAILESISTGVEIVRSGGAVEVGGQSLATGESTVIEEETLIRCGDTIELRVSPGGGTSLAQSREKVQQLRSTWNERLATPGLGSLDEAGDVLAKREAIAAELREIEATLAAKEPATLEKELSATTSERAALEAEIERRAARLATMNSGDTTATDATGAPHPPADPAAATRFLAEARATLDRNTNTLLELKSRRSALQQSLAELESRWEAAKAAARESEHSLIEHKARLKARAEPLGDPAQYEARRSTLRAARDRTRDALAATQEALAELQPDALAADITRLERALQVSRDTIQTARERRAVAREALSNDGSSDPHNDLEQARARLESATERHRNLHRRAEAIRLLRERFGSEQQRLSDLFSRPLARKVSLYLQQIFGAGAEAAVTVEDGVIGGWSMTRSGARFDFETLSGGTREQVAAAVRLAMAEILAADHSGSLPVVFDDAFTHSDPERTLSLQRMLDLASRQGLQIILLTCDPAAYASLGAKTTTLSRTPL